MWSRTSRVFSRGVVGHVVVGTLPSLDGGAQRFYFNGSFRVFVFLAAFVPTTAGIFSASCYYANRLRWRYR